MALNFEDGDWIPLWRKIRKHWVWQEPEALRAWIDLIMLANHHDGTFRFRGRPHPIKRGQIPTTYSALAERNGWSRDKVRSFLRQHQNGGSLEIRYRVFDSKSGEWIDGKNDTGFMLLTLVNYPVRKNGQDIPTAESAAEYAGIPQGNRQGIDSGSTANRHIQEGEEGKEGEKGGGGPPASPAEAPLTPPSGVAGGTDRNGSETGTEQRPPAPAPKAPQEEQRTGKPEDIAASYRKHDPFVPEVKALNHIRSAIDRGADPMKLHDSVIRLRATLKLWKICDLVLEKPKAASATRENASAEKPAVLQKPRDKAQEERDLALVQVDMKLSELPPEEVAAWRKEAERDAIAGKVPIFSLEAFVQSAIRIRAARKFGIQGV